MESAAVRPKSQDFVRRRGPEEEQREEREDREPDVRGLEHEEELVRETAEDEVGEAERFEHAAQRAALDRVVDERRGVLEEGPEREPDVARGGHFDGGARFCREDRTLRSEGSSPRTRRERKKIERENWPRFAFPRRRRRARAHDLSLARASNDASAFS